MLWRNSKKSSEITLENEQEMPFFHAELLRKVVYFEWILILICAVGEIIDWIAITFRFHQPDPSTPNLITSLIFLLIVFLLSFVVPVKNTYWDRLCFLFLEIVLLTGCAASGLARFVFPIYMVSVAKAYLLLDRPGLAIIFSAALFTQFANGCFKFFITTPWMQQNPFSLSGILIMMGSSLVMNYAAFSMMVLVGMLTETLVAEKRATQESERLSDEVEKLATELERTRIAREIHDSLGHTLTSLNIQLEVARKFSKRDNDRSLEALDLAKQLASQSLTDVRTAVQSIRHPDLDLNEAVHKLAAQLQQTQSLEVIVNMSAPNVSSAINYQLFRIIQECLTNVMKHAEAKSVKVELKHDKKNIELNVSDDGKGLPQEEETQGFGLRGMQERVESMHGTVHIHSAPNEGTRLQVIIPL
ncbi:MAG: sensor histidine kinase [Candidatus Obscuribacterales bacterium]|nr:sensor histidine kinase [Candidatus Obscuribacterales bacterium]